MMLAPGPGIALRIDAFEGLITRAELSLSPTFSCEIYSREPHLEKEIAAWLLQYAKRIPSPLPALFDLETLSPFQKTVLSQMKRISFGETKSYKELAEMSGTPKGSRAIGGACNRNPFPLFFPCHRIIGSDGTIGGFALDLEIKRRLLRFEGKDLLPS